MTKSETISNLKAYLDGDTAIGNIIPLRSVLESAIRYLEISLPSNLDDAAEEYEHNLGLFEHINLWPITAFKSGAEWMANSGIVTEAFIRADGMGVPMIHFYDDEVKELIGDEVVVQIRKK